jgi:hypothetical protein
MVHHTWSSELGSLATASWLGRRAIFCLGLKVLALLLLPPSQPYPRSASVLVDELDAGAFESAPNYLKGRATRLTYPRFKLVHGHDTHARVPSEFLLAPSKQPSGCPTLAWRDHRAKYSGPRSR